jgi:hypothetical protein
MPDFDTVAATLNCHFCPECGSSFECAREDDGCTCPGQDYNYPPWCDSCADAQKAEEEREAEEQLQKDGASAYDEEDEDDEDEEVIHSPDD